MPELILVSNPSKRRVKRKRASRAQLRARRLFISRYGKKGRSMAKRKRRVKRKATTSRRYRRRTRARTSRRRYARNPSFRRGFSSGSVMNLAKTAATEGAIGAGGAVAANLVWGYAASSVLPADWTTGNLKYLGRAATAVLVGVLGNKMLPGKGTMMAAGGFTVLLHDLLKSTLMAQFPSLPLSEYLAYSPGSGPIVGTYGDQGLGALPDLSQGMNSLGFNSFETDTLGEYLNEYN